MAERREYELTEADLDRLMAASKPVPYMVFNGVEPLSPQENANAVWQAIAREMRFKWDTVKPVSQKSTHYFTAEPL